MAPLHLYSAADTAVVTDPNGLLLNPYWRGGSRPAPPLPDIEDDCRFRVETEHLERRDLMTTKRDCLSKEERQLVSLNEITPALGLGIVCVTGGKTGKVKGHVNWFPITATGQLVWNSFSAGAGDHDVNIDFVTKLPNASTAANATFPEYGGQPGYHTESYYEETFDRLPGAEKTFWHALKDVHLDNERAHALVDDRFAIMTGVFGVDGVHGYHAELHPVHAMSVLVDTSTVAGKLREQWAVMLRNTGSEGDCAEGTLPLRTAALDSSKQDFFVDLGAWADGGAPNVLRGTAWSTDGEFLPTQHVEQGADGQRIYLRMIHRRPAPGSPDFLFFGTFYVDWPSAKRSTWSQRFIPLVPPHGRPIKFTELALPLQPIPPEKVVALADDEGPKLPPKVLAVRTPPWPLSNQVRPLDCSKLDKSNQLCFKAARWVGGVARARDEYFPVISRFRYPHSSYFYGEGTWNTIVNVVYTLGDRWDLRLDRHRPKPGTKDYGKGSPDRCVQGWYPASDARCGVSLRWNPYVSPNSVRLSKNFVIVPYTAGQLGISWLDRASEPWYHGFGFITGFGLGTQLQLWNHDLFIERQATGRSWYENQWVTTIGWLTPLWR